MTLRLCRLLALLVTASLTLPAQVVTSLRQTGPRANRVNFVFVGDGYTAAESAKFVTDATAKLQMLLGNEAWVRFASLVNADALFVASAQSGADDPATGTVRDTYFNSTFGTQGTDQLLTIDGPGTQRLLTLLIDHLPDFDVVILLVNAVKYGGSGGFPTITSLNPESDEILLHELGHSFAALADEYVDATAAANHPAIEYPNATQQSSPSQIPWRLFIQPTTAIPTVSAPSEDIVGLFTGSNFRATGFYRPTYNSKMRELHRPFGPVNLRAFANRIHRLDLNNATAPPIVATQPLGAAVAAGQAVTLSVTASGTGPLTYQWLFNSRYIVNAVDPNLTVTSMSAATAGTYAVEVTNAVGTVVSDDANLTLVTTRPPRFVVQPVNATVAVGSPVTFAATADALPAATYQWQKDGVTIPAATSSTLSLASVTTADLGMYSVVASNPLGSAMSNGALLAVSPAPVFVSQPPGSIVVTVGSTVTLSVTVSAMPAATIQWRKNGVQIPNATGPTLVLTGVTVAHAGTYSVVATNSLGSATAGPFQLVVAAP